MLAASSQPSWIEVDVNQHSYQELEVSLESHCIRGSCRKAFRASLSVAQSTLFLSRKKMGKLEALPLNLGPIPSPSLVSGKRWLYEFPGETTEKNGQSQGDQLGSVGPLKEPWKVFHYYMWLSNCSLKGTHATQLPRNLSHQFQDRSPFGHRLLIFLPRQVLRACLSTEQSPIEVQSLSQSPRRRTYLVSRRLRERLHRIEESERGSCLRLRQSWLSESNSGAHIFKHQFPHFLSEHAGV